MLEQLFEVVVHVLEVVLDLAGSGPDHADFRLYLVFVDRHLGHVVARDVVLAGTVGLVSTSLLPVFLVDEYDV